MYIFAYFIIAASPHVIMANRCKREQAAEVRAIKTVERVLSGAVSKVLAQLNDRPLCGSSRAAKNSDFVRVIGFFNPPLRVRTDIYAINDLFGLWTRYKIGINLNYSDTSHFAHVHGTS